MRLRSAIDLTAAFGVATGVLLALTPAGADDGSRFVKPSVEELAIPADKKPGDAAAVSDTREAMCLMIE